MSRAEPQPTPPPQLRLPTGEASPTQGLGQQHQSEKFALVESGSDTTRVEEAPFEMAACQGA
eukprot:7428884-Lingulodinium_polyedra.AAC.1